MPISIPTSVAGISIPGAINGPLNLLYGNKYVKTNLRFPRDLGSNPTRQHVIMFTVQKPVAIATGAVVADNGESFSGIPAGNYATLPDASGLDKAKAVYNTGKSMIENARAGAPIVSKETSEAITNLIKPKIDRDDSDSISLYIPDTLNVQYAAGYNDVSVTSALGTPYFLAQGAVSLFNTFKDQGDLKVSNLINAAGSDPFARLAASKLVDKVLGTSVTDLALAAGGFALNPQLQVLFQGIGFRSFQFDFVFTPYSKEEADTIKEIIKKFKYAAAPEITSNGMFSQGLFMKIPDTFKIDFLHKGATNDKIHRIGECVLENINVDYASAGQWSTHNDGSPVQTRMTLQFRETVIIDKTRIGEGY